MQREIQLYESLLAISEEMNEAAARSDWDAVSQCEQSHYEIYMRLKEIDGDDLGAQELKRKEMLLNAILSIDKITQGLIQERMAVLQKGIGDEMRITQAYGPPSV